MNDPLNLPMPNGASVPTRRCVLVFAGADPSAGAGVYADLQAIAAVGAHALPVVTVLTAQDNNRVHAIYPVSPQQVRAQADAVIDTIAIAAVKIGIVGSRLNAECIAAVITQLKVDMPHLPVVLDPVLASGHGDALSRDDARDMLQPLFETATLVTPNLPEAVALCAGETDPARQAAYLFEQGARHVLIKGGHGAGNTIVNRWFAADGRAETWQWPRLDGDYHGSGCTLASAIAGRLAIGDDMREAIARGQAFCQQALVQGFAIAAGQRIPNRTFIFEKDAP